jgi:hypothetical protein
MCGENSEEQLETSPDLVPSRYYLFGFIKDQMQPVRRCGKPSVAVYKLLKQILPQWDLQTPRMVAKMLIGMRIL